jgi:hypothetical protein
MRDAHIAFFLDMVSPPIRWRDDVRARIPTRLASRAGEKEVTAVKFHRSRGAWRTGSATAGLLALLLAAPAATPVFAAPAATLAGGASHSHDACIDPEAPTGVSAKVGRAAHEDPNALTPAQVAQRERELTDARRRRAAGPTTRAAVTIPVYFHIISRDGTRATGEIPDSMVHAQMQVLNNSYAGATGGAATGFSFALQGINHVTNPAWSPIWPNNANSELAMKAALREGGMETLNIYTGHTNGQAVYGWGTMPQSTFSTKDGVVVQHETLPGGTAPQYNNGDTAVHEVGHWLNLYHTFQNGCENGGDQVADTADESIPAFDCPTGRDTCTTPGPDPITNFMDYTEDACQFQFTAGQAARMTDGWNTYRAP